MSEDLRVKQRVLDELDFTPDVDAAHIGISVHDGIVSLSGYVASVHEKLAAEDAVRRVKGVRAIAEELEVRLPADKKLADDQIAQRALRLLEWDLCLPPGAIGVAVSHGVVSLSGIVEWQYQRHEAEKDMRKLGGVTNVINDIQVRPEVSAAEVRDVVQAALERDARLDAQAIVVEVRSGGIVVLRGHVRTLHEQITAEVAAGRARGVSRVENHIAVRPSAEPAVPAEAKV
jgi:osmotically-inducible protein OsmY